MARQPAVTAGAGNHTAVPLQRLNADGQVDGAVPMRSDQILEAYRLMVQSRAIDDLATKLQRLKRVGLYAPVHGQEAAVVGSAMALDPHRDWMVPASREQPAMIRHGLPLINFFAGYMGRLNHAEIPHGVKLLPRQQAIGAQLPHAAGLAWAMKLRHEHAAVMVYCGDGASSEGDFHESLNLAGVMRVPLVIVVINNQYAISTPFHKQTAAEKSRFPSDRIRDARRRGGRGRPLRRVRRIRRSRDPRPCRRGADAHRMPDIPSSAFTTPRTTRMTTVTRPR